MILSRYEGYDMANKPKWNKKIYAVAYPSSNGIEKRVKSLLHIPKYYQNKIKGY